MVISGHRWSLAVIGGHCQSSAVIGGHPRSSPVYRGLLSKDEISFDYNLFEECGKILSSASVFPPSKHQRRLKFGI